MKDKLANPANRPTLALGVLCLFLMLVLLVQLIATPTSIELPPATTEPGELPEPEMVAAIDMPSLAEFENIVERPLFSEDRRPIEEEAEAEVAEVVETPVEPPDLALAGVVLTGEHQIAMLTNQGEPLRLQVGMDVEGWVLEMLEPRRAVFSNGSDSLELELPVYVAPEPRRARGRQEGGPPEHARRARRGEDDSGANEQAMSVRERIQRAREERERMRELMRQQAETGRQLDAGSKKDD